MKIWITGIAGFLGSHLADPLIAEGHEVWGNDNLTCGDTKNVPDKAMRISTLNENLEGTKDKHFIEQDCRNFDFMKSAFVHAKPDVVVHCAATAHEGLSSFSPSFVTKNIYEASVATFSAAIAAGVKRIVYMSSMSRYGDGPLPFAETNETMPVDPYGIAKVSAEQTLRVLCETHGVAYSIACPHNIIGPRQRSVDPYRNVAAIMINRCKQGKPPIVYGDGMQMRCFSPVKDCLPSLIKMVNGEADGEIVNIGPDHSSITINELAVQIMAMCNFEGEPIYVPGRPNEVKDAYCSSEKARRLLGFEVKQSLMDCLKEMVDTIKPEPFLYDFPLEIVTERTPKTWTERMI